MPEKTPFSVEEANDSTGFLLWQVTALWGRRIAQVLRPHDLTQVQFALLAGLLWLSKTERHITQVMLARHAKLDVMMTSQVLRSLETKGIIKRLPHPQDMRANILRLTRSGRAHVWKAVPNVEQADREFFSAMGGRNKQFNDALLAMIEASSGKA